MPVWSSGLAIETKSKSSVNGWLGARPLTVADTPYTSLPFGGSGQQNCSAVMVGPAAAGVAVTVTALAAAAARRVSRRIRLLSEPLHLRVKVRPRRSTGR